MARGPASDPVDSSPLLDQLLPVAWNDLLIGVPMPNRDRRGAAVTSRRIPHATAPFSGRLINAGLHAFQRLAHGSFMHSSALPTVSAHPWGTPATIAPPRSAPDKQRALRRSSHRLRKGRRYKRATGRRNAARPLHQSSAGSIAPHDRGL